MEEMKLAIAKNIAALRQARRMTQLELAEKLNYSDKAISKWERGESIPDVLVLKSIADMFGVSLDYLLEADHEEKPKPSQESPGYLHRNRKVTTTLSVLLVWFVATLAYVVMDLAIQQSVFKWIPFAYAVPVSMIVWLVFNSIWGRMKLHVPIISGLLWSLIATIFIIFYVYADYNLWVLFLIGIPSQVFISLFLGIRKPKDKSDKEVRQLILKNKRKKKSADEAEE